MLHAIVSSVTRLAEVNPGGGGLYLDLLNIQWWQAFIAIVVALGLSPAPWILGLASGKLMFRSDLERQLKERDEAHEKALAERDRHHAAMLAAAQQRYDDLAASNTKNIEAAQQERVRADRATETLGTVAEALEANSHIMASLRDTVSEAAK